MTISAPIAITVGAEAFSLPALGPIGRNGLYRDWSADGNSRLIVNTKHTDPTATSKTESHMFRADLETYSSGESIRNSAFWLVWKTTGGSQDTAEMLALYTGVVAALEATSNTILTAILNGEP